MRAVLRGLMWVDQAEKPTCDANYKVVRVDRLTNMRKAETALVEYCQDFYVRHGEAPQHASVVSHFEAANLSEEVVLLDEIQTEGLIQGASYNDTFEREVEDQAGAKLITVMRTAQKIATTGEKIGSTIVKGTDAAVNYLFTEAKPAPKNSDDRMPASMKGSDQALKDLYTNRKNNPAQTYGILTGYGLVDSATAGIRKKQLYLLGGFGGHLKTTWAMNHLLNAVVMGGWNGSYFSSEMPAEDLKLMMIAMHSADPKFNGIGRPLKSFNLLLGNLTAQEEAFKDDVQDDLINNRNHGNFRIYDPADFTTLGSVFQQTVQDNMEEEVDFLWIDYVTRLPLDPKYRGMDITSARNEQLIDTKRFALAFNQGQGLAVGSPFQVNRTGYLKAKTQEGQMDKTHLAQYNSAEREADVISYIWYDLEEQATSEPKIGMLKSRWGKAEAKPVPVFIEPDSRRIMDLTAGMGPATGFAPTMTSEAEGEVVL